ncbi:hypothetical protein [Streptomyces sp. EN16]|uniref:hypothetical protein n=1 Tax=Streptomyces sp. EN16 TaxID=212773 RepID=UPI000851AC2D|nr:hypothetical protein [Streptomyces sp. EN16]
MRRPEKRLGAERSQFRAMWIVAAGLVAWLAFGLVREPAASWPERCVVIVLACCFAAPMIGTMGYRKTLPALDRTPRRATVTGHVHFSVDPDSDSDMPAYDLIEVRVDIDSVQVDTSIADIVAAESLARFAVGSVWDVYAFEDPAKLDWTTTTGPGSSSPNATRTSFVPDTTLAPTRSIRNRDRDRTCSCAASPTIAARGRQHVEGRFGHVRGAAQVQAGWGLALVGVNQGPFGEEVLGCCVAAGAVADQVDVEAGARRRRRGRSR